MDSTTEALIEDIRKRGWARPMIEIIQDAVDQLPPGPGQSYTLDQMERLIAAAEYWEDAQRKAFEDYLEVKKAGWPEEYRTPEVAWPGEVEGS